MRFRNMLLWAIVANQAPLEEAQEVEQTVAHKLTGTKPIYGEQTIQFAGKSLGVEFSAKEAIKEDDQRLQTELTAENIRDFFQKNHVTFKLPDGKGNILFTSRIFEHVPHVLLMIEDLILKYDHSETAKLPT